MKAYEVVREIPNLCANNQMRDVFFDEVETDDPVEYVRSIPGPGQRLCQQRRNRTEVSLHRVVTPGRFFSIFSKRGLYLPKKYVTITTE